MLTCQLPYPFGHEGTRSKSYQGRNYLCLANIDINKPVSPELDFHQACRAAVQLPDEDLVVLEGHVVVLVHSGGHALVQTANARCLFANEWIRIES